MARIVPDGWEALDGLSHGQQREIDTLKLLKQLLPSDYTVYHSVHWASVEHRHTLFGEVDFVVVNRHGNLLLIEQKSGFLEETPEGLVKNYLGKSKSVTAQMARSRDALLTKLRSRPQTSHVQVDSLLFCPHHTVRNALTAGIDPERIVDARRKDELGQIIQSILPPGEDSDTRAVHRFLSDVLQLEISVGALVGQADQLVTRISGGLAHWARQLAMTPFRLRVIGTAGSGKTQLALAEYRATIEAGKRPLFVCFNRPLSDHMEQIAPPGGWIGTFHMLCEAVVRAAGETPNFQQANAFDALIQRAAALPVPAHLQFDSVIIDEGQDWKADWRDLALRHARPDGATRLFWLEDPMQNLYGRPEIVLENWVQLYARANYRSPRGIVRFLQQIMPTAPAGNLSQEIEAASPFDGGEIEFFTYTDRAGMLQQVKMAIKACYAAGFRKSDVAVISYHGRESSHLIGHHQLGDFSFRSFTGSYDLLQRPVYGEGDVLLESVMRFKGQSAPAVVFAEVDFTELDDKALRRLFVGATRANMKLCLVISEEAAAQLLAHMHP